VPGGATFTSFPFRKTKQTLNFPVFSQRLISDLTTLDFFPRSRKSFLLQTTSFHNFFFLIITTPFFVVAPLLRRLFTFCSSALHLRDDGGLGVWAKAHGDVSFALCVVSTAY